MGVTGIFWAAPAADVLAIFVTAAVMVRVWKELGQEKEEREPAAAAIRPSRQGTVITIAREHGSAGKGHPPYCGRRFLRYHRALGGLCAASLSECGAYLYLCPGKLPGEKGNGDVRGQPGGCEKSIARSDAARSAYYKSISGQEWGNPHGYELCIDASVGEEAAADMICSYIRRMGRS